MMTKSDTIEAIVARNPTANRTFLAEFSNIELTEYKQRLDECAAGAAAPVSDRCPALRGVSPCAVSGAAAPAVAALASVTE